MLLKYPNSLVEGTNEVVKLICYLEGTLESSAGT